MAAPGIPSTASEPATVIPFRMSAEMVLVTSITALDTTGWSVRNTPPSSYDYRGEKIIDGVDDDFADLAILEVGDFVWFEIDMVETKVWVWGMPGKVLNTSAIYCLFDG